MDFHASHALGLRQRHALLTAIKGGLTLRAAAAAFSVSPATVHRWWHRWVEAAEEERRTRVVIDDDSRLAYVELTAARTRRRTPAPLERYDRGQDS